MCVKGLSSELAPLIFSWHGRYQGPFMFFRHDLVRGLNFDSTSFLAVTQDRKLRSRSFVRSLALVRSYYEANNERRISSHENHFLHDVRKDAVEGRVHVLQAADGGAQVGRPKPSCFCFDSTL